MKINHAKYLYIITFFIGLLFSSIAFAKSINDKLEISGFARLVSGHLAENDAIYLGYDNNVKLFEQSLIALQVDYKIIDNLSLTGQAIAHSADNRNSGVEWLYLTYAPNRFTQIKLGKQRTPFFNYSDTNDVGFSYPWITLPQQVYGSFFFRTFNGILGSYEWSSNRFALNAEAFYGRFDDDVVASGTSVRAKVDNFHGIVFNAQYDNFTFRAAFHRGEDVNIILEGLTNFRDLLDELGFTASARTLDSNGGLEFYQSSLSYETLDYFFRTEVIKVKAERAVVTDIDSFYIAAGYNYFPYTSYISFAQTRNAYGDPVNVIPTGINTQLDTLSAQYDFLFSALPVDDSESITIGTRFDWKPNLAIKAEVTFVNVEVNADVIFNISNDDFDRQAPLYQLALEWVF